jgi:ElaB/YqjD/DUF883 family membrane-anchored ribosome-binding protein
MSSSDFSSSSASAEKITSSAQSSIDAATEAAKDFCSDITNSIRTSFEENPSRTILIAGGIGLAIGALWMTNRYMAANNSSEWSKLSRHYADVLRNLR